MTATAPPKRRPSRSDHAAVPGLLPTPDSSAASAPLRKPSAHGHGGEVMFEVAFTSAMSDPDLAVLARVLDLSTHMYPKMRPDPNSPGVARLDHFSGLFLERGTGEGQWRLEGRTWGQPAPETVHEWHVLAALAARQLDPGVTLPEPMFGTQPSTPERPLGHAANKRLAHVRRRLVGLP
jgi:hypothetical protein